MKIEKVYIDKNEFSALCNSNIILIAKSKFIKTQYKIHISDSFNIQLAEKYLAVTVIHNLTKNLAKQRLLNYKNADPFNKTKIAICILTQLDEIFKYKQKFQFNEYIYNYFNVFQMILDIKPPTNSVLYNGFVNKQNYIFSILSCYFEKEMISVKLTPETSYVN